MDASSGQHQEMATNSLENILVCSKAQQERKPRPQPEQALKCPRCDSTNTKFCYYNNYSLSQPRYFCKSCRRYWTKGGTLRNVPVGGGCRKNKRSSSSSSSASSKRTQDHQPLTLNTNPLTAGLPPLSYDSNDLSLAFARLQKQTGEQLGFDHDHHDHHHHHHHDFPILGNPTNTHYDLNLGNPSSISLDSLRSRFLDTQNGFQNLYYGYGGGNLGEVDQNNGGGVGVSGGEMMLPYGADMINSSSSNNSNATTTAVTVTAMKQELCNNNNNNNRSSENENKILWGFPWQLNNNNNGDHHHHHGNLVIGDLDSGKESWNGLNSPWHGLLNSPLM
ncbi:hypothetical protein ACOSP7_016497 [Xanthoceras sorbifolium]